MFALDRAGLHLLQIAGEAFTAGGYSVRFSLPGDMNADRQLDAFDVQAITATLGTHAGDAGYILAADANRDDAINATDIQIVSRTLARP